MSNRGQVMESKKAADQQALRQAQNEIAFLQRLIHENNREAFRFLMHSAQHRDNVIH